MNRRDLMTAAIGGLAPAPLATEPTEGDLRGDVAVLRAALDLHPGLYRYAAPSEVEGRLAAFEAEWRAAPDTAARYLALSRFLATIRCGHTYANFFNQKKAGAAELFDRPTRLPLQFAWLGGKMIVTGDPGRLGVPVGSEIETLNGRPARAVLSALMRYARADGHNDAKRVSLLGVSGSEKIETFDVFHGLVFGAPDRGVHVVTLRRPSGETERRELPAIGLAARRAQSVGPEKTAGGPLWTWTMRPDGVAVLTMPTWAVYDSAWDWKGWLRDRLDSLSGAKGLVVDLRANEGGLDCGDAILARLTDAPVSRPAVDRRVRFQKTPPALDPVLDTWDNSFRTLGVAATPIGDGVYRLPARTEDGAIAPAGGRLPVKVAALIGPANSSATFQFAELGQATGLVRLVGEPTGGNRRGINGGAFFFVRLPASGLEFDLPLIGYYPPGLPPDEGLRPDLAIAPTPQDIAAGRDVALEVAARSLVRR